MTYHSVKSSIISSMGYDYENKILEIELKRHNQTRQYFNVPTDLWIKLKNANSTGKFFLKNIKDNFDELKLVSNK